MKRRDRSSQSPFPRQTSPRNNKSLKRTVAAAASAHRHANAPTAQGKDNVEAASRRFPKADNQLLSASFSEMSPFALRKQRDGAERGLSQFSRAPRRIRGRRKWDCPLHSETRNQRNRPKERKESPKAPTSRQSPVRSRRMRPRSAGIPPASLLCTLYSVLRTPPSP
jgi:hypothetical protein